MAWRVGREGRATMAQGLPRAVGLLRRVVVRHGEHEGQEGRPGSAGGSKPGFTHAGNGAGGEIGLTFETWQKQPFDEVLASSYADAIEEKYGLTPADRIVNATWIAPDGRALLEGVDHEGTSQHALSVVNGVDTDDGTISITQVVQAGLIRHTFWAYGQEVFVISGADTLTNAQKKTLKSIANARVDQRADVKIPSGRDTELVGLRMYVSDEVPSSLDPISQPLNPIKAVDLIPLLGLKRSEWRASQINDDLVVSTAPRILESGELVTERHYAPIHPGTGSPQSVHAGKGSGKTEQYVIPPKKFGELKPPRKRLARAVAWGALDRHPALVAALNFIEQKIGKNDFETGYLLAPGGELLLEKVGTEREIIFTDDELAMFEGNILVHNHPLNEDTSQSGVAYSKSFSGADIIVSAERGATEVIALGGDGTRYMMRINWQEEFDDIDSVVDELNRIRVNTINDFWGKINSGVFTKAKAEATTATEFMKRLENEYPDAFDYVAIRGER